jgi:hypothetical protein
VKFSKISQLLDFSPIRGKPENSGILDDFLSILEVELINAKA